MRESKYRWSALVFFLIGFMGSPFASGRDDAAVATRPAAIGEPTFVSRHLKILASEASSRYRYIDKERGNVCDRDWQYKLSARVQINLDEDGRSYLQMRAESGRSFSSSWDYAANGLNKNYWSFNLKSLYYGQKVGAHWELQAGGIDFDYGAGTEATYADTDGWLEGYRASYRRDLGRYRPNRIDVTLGYAGDFTQPNFFARSRRMAEVNYAQVLAFKDVTKTISASVEWDYIDGVQYLREAVRGKKVSWHGIADEFSAESIARLSGGRTLGWSGSLGRHFSMDRFFLSGFYSDVPKRMFLRDNLIIFLNGDTYLLGKRIGCIARLNLHSDLEMSGLLSRRLDSTQGHRLRGQLALRYKLSTILTRMVQQR